MTDPYSVLGVPRGADAATIKAAYRKLARRFHPDVNGSPDAERRMKEVNEAYAMLRDRVGTAATGSGRPRGGGTDDLNSVLEELRRRQAEEERRRRERHFETAFGFMDGVDVNRLFEAVFRRTQRSSPRDAESYFSRRPHDGLMWELFRQWAEQEWPKAHGRRGDDVARP